VIRLRGLSKAFGDNTVLRDLDLDVPTGRTVAVLGRSGSGKSVLLKTVARLLRADAGEAWVGDTDMTTADEATVKRVRGEMGYVFQFAALFDSMTVGENVQLPLRRAGVGRREARERAERALDVVGLSGLGGKLPSELSGGMRKRAGIARAVVTEPRYLLYDEPTTGLDPVTTAMIDQLVLRLKAEIESTGVVVTHDIASAFRVADEVALLHDGRVRAKGRPEEMRESEDPVVRAFVEGRPELWPDGDGV
jgi:phospholipid/cholesterol/gamma-HCH transport system ATP-binding protein